MTYLAKKESGLIGQANMEEIAKLGNIVIIGKKIYNIVNKEIVK